MLIGGASGVGKSTLSRQLANHFQLPLTEVDSFQLILERMTTPEQQPALHFWRTHPEAMAWPPERILELHLDVGRVIATALHAVMEDHLASAAPLILEGDYILPEVAAAYPSQVLGLFLDEPDLTQIVDNFSRREPESGQQTGRAQVSWLYNEWLRKQCQQLGVPMLAVRPWDTLLNRALHQVS